ncbi:helix-turn-helix transcriptional regulator [Paenibacillus polymyxa]|nr:helix-turn-helix transcriptional regulator [Paenibacillus polymyxa]
MNKLSQTEFSQIIGVSQGALSELEKDKQAIIGSCDCSANEFVVI